LEGLIKKLGQFSVGPIIGAVLGFITVPVVTYFITPDEYGRASMFTLAISILQMFVFLGMDQAYTKRYYESEDKIKLLTNSMLPSIVLVILIDAGIFIFRRDVSVLLFDTDNEMFCVYALMAILPGLAAEKFALMDIRMQQRGLLYSMMSILLKSLTLVCMVGLLLGYERSFRSIVIGTTLAQLIYTVIILLIERSRFRIRFSLLDKQEMKRLVRFGLPIVPTMIIGWALSGMDKVMLRAFCDYSELGMYEVAFKVANIVGIVQSCFTSFWVPVAHQWNNENVDKNNFVKAGRLVAFLMTAIFICVLLVKDVIFMILSSEYADAVKIAPFLMMYPIMYTISEVTVMGIYFKEKTLNLIVVSIVASAVNISLNWILIPICGAVGASIATGLAYAVFFWVRTIISRKIWFRFPIAEYIFITLVLIVSGALNVLIDGWPIYAVNAAMLIITAAYFHTELREICGFALKLVKKH
jgi:O-antigen/teichoic acid export membrane protein